MLFYLTNSLITLEGAQEYKDVVGVINNFIMTLQQGNHLVSGDIQCLEWARTFYTDKNPLYGAITHLINTFSTNTIPSEIKEYVKVIKGERSQEDTSGVSVHSIPYQEFQEFSSVDKMSIVGEDENDAKFYDYICKWYQHKIGTSYSTACIKENGGGKNTDRKILNLKSRNKPFTCIIDTDERYPGGPKGHTYGACANLTYNQPLEFFHSIQAHEIENIIPKVSIDSLPSCSAIQNKTAKNGYDSILENLEDKTLWRYIDLKKGIVKNSDLCSNIDWHNFCESIYNLNEHKTKNFHEKFQATSDKDPIMPGLSKYILREALEYLDRNGIERVNDFLDFQMEEWEKIGRMLLSKCICHGKETMNY